MQTKNAYRPIMHIPGAFKQTPTHNYECNECVLFILNNSNTREVINRDLHKNPESAAWFPYQQLNTYFIYLNDSDMEYHLIEINQDMIERT